eukprot:2767511-Pleurochrysis_carterae.AAC.1
MARAHAYRVHVRRTRSRARCVRMHDASWPRDGECAHSLRTHERYTRARAYCGRRHDARRA